MNDDLTLTRTKVHSFAELAVLQIFAISAQLVRG